MRSILLKALPHAVAILVFFLLSAIFFSPAFQGFDLRQGDIDQYVGMSKEIKDFRSVYHSDPLWTNSMFSGMPAYQISVEQTRSLPALLITGMRTVFPGPVGILFLAMLSFYILGLCMKVNPWLSILGAVGFGFASINILYLGAGHASKVIAIALMPATLGGVLLTFRRSLYLGIGVTALFASLELAANHLQMTYYLLILIGFVALFEFVKFFRKRELKNAGKVAGGLVIAAVIAILPNFTNIVTTYEYSKYTTRGPSNLTIDPNGDPIQEKVETDGLGLDYMLDYSFARGEFWSILIPDLKGGQSSYIGNDSKILSNVDQRFREPVAQQNRYWGDQRFTGGAFYFGALIMCLFMIGMFVVKDSIKWPILIVTLIAIVLSWKDYSGMTVFFAEFVPLFDKFRDTKMMMVVVQVSASLMAVLCVDELLKSDLKEVKAKLLAGSGLVLGVLVLFAAAPTLFFDFFNDQDLQQFESFREQASGNVEQTAYLNGLIQSLENARIAIFRSDVLRSLIFAVVAIGGAWLLILKKMKSQIVIAGLVVFALIDLWSVDRRYINNEKSGGSYTHWIKKIDKFYPFEAHVADLAILESEVNSGQLQSEVETFVKLKEEEIGKSLERRFPKIRDAAMFGALDLNSNFRVLSLNNPFNNARTSYFHKSIGGYHGAKLKRYQDLIDFYLIQEQNAFVETANSIGLDVAFNAMKVHNMLNARYLIADLNSPPIPNRYAYGNAWFVEGIKWAESNDEEILSLGEIDPRSEAVVHREFEHLTSVIRGDSTSVATLNSYLPNELKYEVKSEKGGLVVFSEIYYPKGWQAFIGEEPVEHMRVNYVLRGLVVPPGSHDITFKFMPTSYQLGQTVSLFGSIILILVFAGSVWIDSRKGKLQLEGES